MGAGRRDLQLKATYGLEDTRLALATLRAGIDSQRSERCTSRSNRGFCIFGTPVVLISTVNEDGSFTSRRCHRLFLAGLAMPARPGRDLEDATEHGAHRRVRC